MWYEILPPIAIMVVAMCIPQATLHYSQKYFLGTPIKRSLITHRDFLYYMRDQSFTGNPYIVQGLESIKDE